MNLTLDDKIRTCKNPKCGHRFVSKWGTSTRCPRCHHCLQCGRDHRSKECKNG